MKRKTKKASVSKNAQTQPAARFDKSHHPGPEFVWHDSFDYRHKGLVIRVRGHWEKNPNLVKSKKQVGKPRNLRELAKAKTPDSVPVASKGAQ